MLPVTASKNNTHKILEQKC